MNVYLTEANTLLESGLLDEYKAALNDSSAVSSRRQTINSLFVTLNSIFLTAVGIFAPVHLSTWSGPISVIVVACVATPVNFVWRTTLISYRSSQDVRALYIRTLENEIAELRRASGYVGRDGLYRTLQGALQNRLTYASRREQLLAAYFCWPLTSLRSIL